METQDDRDDAIRDDPPGWDGESEGAIALVEGVGELSAFEDI